MSDYELLIDMHRDGDRQGPGGDAETELALNLAGLDRTTPLKIADLGCGTGASTRQLARLLSAQITAVDFLPQFLDILNAKAAEMGLADQITTLACSIDDLPFEPESYDVIWSEGAIYNIGFEKGVREWRPYLKMGGLLVVSEITWLTATRPAEIHDFWVGEYPEIDVASAKMAVLEKEGYAPLGYFVLPEHCWLDNYYRPMQARHGAFLARHGHSEAAQAIVAAEVEEISLYERYKAYYSYGVYVAQKV